MLPFARATLSIRSAAARMTKDGNNRGLAAATDGDCYAMGPLRVASAAHQYPQRFPIGRHQRQQT